ncbi:enoyl-CoA hydratase-related protein [Micromonospora sp. NPDC007271]|uniref:enoyl-CoA hydratase/isomerase family protein n=1 Tax=Micromonospora sp. NPDC007271 TaxID=3154587 RepID=UPI0033D001EC
MADGTTVVVRRAGQVAELMLDRPAARNALNTVMAEQIASACAELAEDPSVRAVVVASSSPKAFCVGADLKERSGFGDADLLRQRQVFRAAFGGVRALPMPVVAAVHGYALGGGFELALSCDLIVADETAVLGLPEVRVGLVPGGGGTQLLSRRVGLARASDLIFTGRQVRIDEAERLGLVDRRVPAGQALPGAHQLADEIAANSPVGVRNAKRALTYGADLPVAAGLEVEDSAWHATAFSGDRREGIAAFAERRAPRWPGH